jgi:hypothetical protein
MITETPEMKTRWSGTTFSNGCDMCARVLLTKKGRQALADYAGEDFQQLLTDAVRAERFGEVREEVQL